MLADRLGGGRGIVTPWPTDDPLCRAMGVRSCRRCSAARLRRRRPPDGDIGTKSKAAIADFEQKAGLEVNGRASVKVLEALKK